MKPDECRRRTITFSPSACALTRVLALVHAVHFDDDEDGLPNHWEKAGLDWMRIASWRARLVAGAFRCRPTAQGHVPGDGLAATEDAGLSRWVGQPPYLNSLTKLTDIFASAPLTNPDGFPGINSHIDAGPGRDPDGLLLTLNMGSATPSQLQGGDEVHVIADRLDVIRMGAPAATYGAFQWAPWMRSRMLGSAVRTSGLVSLPSVTRCSETSWVSRLACHWRTAVNPR